MKKQLEGKRVLVTGGSRGIGRAIVIELAKLGADVLFTYHSNRGEAAITETEAKKYNATVKGIQADLTSQEDMKMAFDYVPENFEGPLNMYIGVAFPKSIFMPTTDMTEEGYDSMFSAVKGHFFSLQKAAQSLADGGKIVVFSSGSASMATSGSGAYGGAKAAIERFALSLSKEIGDRGITVNVVSPGVTQTDGLVAPQEMIDMLVQQTPLNRLGKVDDVAKATVNLVTPQMDWVNGQVVQVNGGIL